MNDQHSKLARPGLVLLRAVTIVAMLFGQFSAVNVAFAQETPGESGNPIFLPFVAGSGEAAIVEQVSAPAELGVIEEGNVQAASHTPNLAVTKDVGGADDWQNPNQQDLSQMGFDNSLANDPTEPVIDVFWSQDNISFPGSGNTASSAALIDGDGDGNVDYALFVTIGEDSSDTVTVDNGLITLADSTQNGNWSFIDIINGQADINGDGVISAAMTRCPIRVTPAQSQSTRLSVGRTLLMAMLTLMVTA